VSWAVSWRPAAAQDIADSAAHLAQDNIRAAVRFIDAVEETVGSLCRNPMLGTATAFQSPDLIGLRHRVVDRFKNYLIFYRADPSTRIVELVRILPSDTELRATIVP
jgi:plasmid stabilization system protein ParE